jgi:Chaperone of endosialidase
MGKKAPKAPDPIQTAAGQTSSNIGTAIAQQQFNNVNQVTPDGTLTYNQSGTYKYTDPLTKVKYDLPTYTATQALSQSQQKIKNVTDQAEYNMGSLASNQSSKLNEYLSKPFDIKSLGARPEYNLKPIELQDLKDSNKYIQSTIGDAGNITKTYGTDFSKDRQRVEDSLMARLNPQLNSDREAMTARLAQQGIRIGSQAYDSAMNNLSTQSNDARMSAILGAGQEQSRLADLEAQRAGFQNSAQQQQYNQNMGKAELNNSSYGLKMDAQEFNNRNALTRQNDASSRYEAQLASRNNAMQEQFAVRNQPINEITALLSGSQVSNPNFINPQVGQIANTDYAGIQNAYDNRLSQNWATKSQITNNTVGGLISGGSSILAASDKNVKKDIKTVGKTNDGQPIYSYRYKGEGKNTPLRMGLMAQDVEKKSPEAVKTFNGIKMVNYDKALKNA